MQEAGVFGVVVDVGVAVTGIVAIGTVWVVDTGAGFVDLKVVEARIAGAEVFDLEVVEMRVGVGNAEEYLTLLEYLLPSVCTLLRKTCM